MPLPEGFNEFEHLQNTIRRHENRKINEYFRELLPDDWDGDLSISEGALKQACLHKDEDTASMTVLRLWLFYFSGQSTKPYQSEQVPVYGIPISTFQQSWKFLPQVMLFFSEDVSDVEAGYDPVTAEISFRLVNESSTTITKDEIKRLGEKIKLALGANRGYRLHKGWDKCTYLDKEKGYDFRLLVFDKATGMAIIEKILDIQEHTPSWEKLGYIENGAPSASYPTNPGTQTILGKSRKKPRRRPRAYVRFRYAALHIHGLPQPLIITNMQAGGRLDI